MISPGSRLVADVMNVIVWFAGLGIPTAVGVAGWQAWRDRKQGGRS